MIKLRTEYAATGRKTLIWQASAPRRASIRKSRRRPRLGQGYWDKPAGIQGEPHIIIDLKQQKVFYYVGATLVGISPMSSGKEGYGTPKGTYKIIQKDANYKSGTYGVLRSRRPGPS